MLRKRHSFFVACTALIFFCSPLFAQDVPPQYKKYFAKFVDKRSIMEKVFNAGGVTNKDVGRSFALICGISKYPKIKGAGGDLKPAAEDIRKLQRYLKRYEFFDEIVVLKNEQVTTHNLEYFLQGYFADRLKKFPKSRFLFAYSGHGMTQNQNGYLLKSTARNLKDRRRSIKVDVLKDYIDEVVFTGHHILVLLNSCFSGTFLRRSFGNDTLFPQYPGAHAITAGGSGEKAWHDGRLGTGSVFFEKILAGLDGKADRESNGRKPDGIITAHELGSYLIDEIRLFTNQDQNPQMGDISLHGSRGEFFFLNRDTPIVQQEVVKISGGTSMGGSAEEVKPGSPKPEQGKAWTEPITGMEFVRVEGGCFQMGGNKYPDEKPVHEVCVDGFQIGKYEVTNAEYVRFLNQVKRRGTTERPWFETEQEDGGSKIQGEIGRFIVKPGYEQHPVNNVSWYGAVAYADWLGQQAGKKFRLPSEAEWEYAARGGIESRGFIYAGSNQLEQVGWYNGNSKSETHQVGQLAANELGLHDMSGNLWEWCADWYDSEYYAERVRDNPQGPAQGSLRVLRGGSSFNSPVHCRSVDRLHDGPGLRYDDFGFRLVLPFQAAGS